MEAEISCFWTTPGSGLKETEDNKDYKWKNNMNINIPLAFKV